MSWECHSIDDLSHLYEIDQEKLINLPTNKLRLLYKQAIKIFPIFFINIGVDVELPIRNRSNREEPISLLLSDFRERVFHFFTNKVTFPEFLANVIYHVFECGIINSFDFNSFLNMNETTLLEKITTAFPRLLETSDFSIKYNFIFSSLYSTFLILPIILLLLY